MARNRAANQMAPYVFLGMCFHSLCAKWPIHNQWNHCSGVHTDISVEVDAPYVSLSWLSLSAQNPPQNKKRNWTPTGGHGSNRTWKLVIGGNSESIQYDNDKGVSGDESLVAGSEKYSRGISWVTLMLLAPALATPIAKLEVWSILGMSRY